MKFINLRKQLSEKVFNRILVIAITVSLTFGIGGQFFVSATADIIPAMRPGGVPDYFGTVPNYANSPLPEIDNAGKVIPGTGIPKFVDSLPGLGADNANEIPLIIQDKTFVPNDTQLAKEDPTWDMINGEDWEIYGFHMYTCQTKTPMIILVQIPWDAGTMGLGFGHHIQATNTDQLLTH